MDVTVASLEYLAAKRARLRPGSLVWYRSRLAVFSAWCEAHGVSLEQVKARVIGEFIDYVRQTRIPRKAGAPLSSCTTQGYVTVIKAFLAFCADDEEYSEFVKFATVRRIPLPKRTELIIDIFTDAQVAALIDASKHNYSDHLRERDACIVAVLTGTGIRADELCKLTIGNTHMDPRDSYIKVEGKGRKQREVPLDDRTRRRLAKYLRHFRDGAKPGAPVFVDRTGKLPIKNSALERIFQRLGEWANIEGVRCSPHTCRHYFAARFWQQHQDIYALSRILGHASVGVTEDYLRSLSGVDVRIALQQRR